MIKVKDKYDIYYIFISFIMITSYPPLPKKRGLTGKKDKAQAPCS